MPRGRKNTRKRQQHGGVKFSRNLKNHLLSNGVSELEIIRFLVSSATHIEVVSDTSRYSFVFKLTLPPELPLLDTFGLTLDESADTRDAFAAKTPELGTPLTTFCAKISFINQSQLNKNYKSVEHYESVERVRRVGRVVKQTTTTDKANKEVDIQKFLFEKFACRRTTAPFVPDVIAHAILTPSDFQGIFNRIPTNIYNWINAWISDQLSLMIDVILMEMLDFERTPPRVPRTVRFQMIHSLQQTAQHSRAALRMMAYIALVRGTGIMPHDFHPKNALATTDGSQLYLIDWGGLFYLKSAEDLQHVLNNFEKLCKKAETTAAEESEKSKNMLSVALKPTPIQRMLTRLPCLEDLCHFFQIQFVTDRDTNISNLIANFQADLTTYQDFTCVAPTQETVHRALMMVAFVDFMTNRIEYNYPMCQCKHGLEVVYPDPVASFDDFRVFLRRFEVGSFPPTTQLPRVVALIEETVQLCPGACAPLDRNMLRPNWMEQESVSLALQKEKEKAEAEAQALITLQQKAKAEAEAEAEAKVIKKLAKKLETIKIDETTAKEIIDQLEQEQAAAIRHQLEQEQAAAIRYQQQQQYQQQQAAAAAARQSRNKSSKQRLFSSGIAKKPQITKPSEIQDIAKIESAIAKQSQAQAQVAVPKSLLSKLNRKSRSKKKGGTRKHKKRNHQHNSTKRR